MSLIVRLPWPDPSLMPNRAKGRAWQGLSALRKKQLADAYALTRSALVTAGPQEFGTDKIPLTLVYILPDTRYKRDLDNLLAASKPLIDGLAKALGVDDSRFEPTMLDKAYCGGDACLMAAVGFEIVSAARIFLEGKK
jgi:crossover junction endodeoxyribonuclease RusA